MPSEYQNLGGIFLLILFLLIQFSEIAVYLNK